MQSEENEWVAINGKLLDDAVRANVWGKPLYAQIAVSFDAISSEAAQIALANRLRRDGILAVLADVRPAHCAGVRRGTRSGPCASRSCSDSGAKSVIARAGSLRHFFLAFGVAGIEYGLGHGRNTSSPTITSGVRAGLDERRRGSSSRACSRLCPLGRPSLALEAGFLPESECRCPSCVASESIAERVATRRHTTLMRRYSIALA